MTDKGASRKNRDDTQAAFLALAAAPEGNGQRCPSSEELAAFVESQSRGEEQQRILSHLGECSSCYEEWLTLHQQIHDQSRRNWAGNVIGLLNSRKTLTWAGSVMGIAAAVVVFLQLRTDYVGLKQVETAAPEAVDERIIDHLPTPQEESELGETNDVEKRDLSISKQRQEPSRKPAARQQQFSLEKSDGAPKKLGEQKTEKLTAPEASRSSTPVQTPPAVSGRVDTGAESADVVGEMVAPAYAEKLRSGCAAGTWEKLFWREMEEELALAGSRDEFMANNRPFQKLSQLVTRAAQDGGNENICREIMAILERMQY